MRRFGGRCKCPEEFAHCHRPTIANRAAYYLPRFCVAQNQNIQIRNRFFSGHIQYGLLCVRCSAPSSPDRAVQILQWVLHFATQGRLNARPFWDRYLRGWRKQRAVHRQKSVW